MECKANLVGVSNDILTGKINITFSTSDKTITDYIDEISNIDLNLKAVKWHKKRSLDSNSYCWHLCTLLANKLGTSKNEIYEKFIQDESIYQEDDNGFIVVSVKACVDMSKIDGHWKYYKDSKDGKFKSYIMLKGSSEFNQEQMNHFLQMIVEECHAHGISTITNEEIRRMNEQWHVNLS